MLLVSHLRFLLENPAKTQALLWMSVGVWTPWTRLSSSTAFLSPSLLPALCSKHLHPLFPNHWCGSCTCVAFSEIATAFLMASMVWHLCFLVFPVLAKTVGDQKVPDSALLALPLLLLCCPHPTSLISVFQSMSAPPCSLVSTFLALPCYSTLWNDTQKVHILSMLNRMKALCFNPHISNIFKTVLCGPPTSESSGSKLTKQIPVSYL